MSELPLGKWEVLEEVQGGLESPKHKEIMKLNDEEYLVLWCVIGYPDAVDCVLIKGDVFDETGHFIVPTIEMFLCHAWEDCPTLSEHPIIEILKGKVDEYLRTRGRE